MPKIQAPSVVEHRNRQRAAILTAASDVFIERGYEGASFVEIAGRAGMARSSVYEYFSSKEELLEAVCAELMPRMLDSIGSAVSRARTPRDQVAAWIRVQLKMVATGEHQLGAVMASAPIGPAGQATLRQMHDSLMPPLVEALGALGKRNGRLTASLVKGIVDAGAARIQAGEPPAAVIRSAIGLALDGPG